MISDRERIARDLHDIVIQRLFATGLQLQGVAAMAGDGAVTDRLDKSVAELDDTIKAIRGTIFELQDRTRRLACAPRSAASSRSTSRCWASAPSSGRPDRWTPWWGRPSASQLLAVLREAISNVARHALADSTEVDVTVTADRLELRVADDGVGLPAAGHRERAAQRAAPRRRPRRDAGGLARGRARHGAGLARPAGRLSDATHGKPDAGGASGFRGLLVTSGRGSSRPRPYGSTSDPAPRWCRPRPGRGPPSRSRRRGGRRRPGCSPAGATAAYMNAYIRAPAAVPIRMPTPRRRVTPMPSRPSMNSQSTTRAVRRGR